jgi:hypothetical protein
MEQWVVRATFYARLSVAIGKVTIVKTTKTMVHTNRCNITAHKTQHSIEDTRPYRHERLRLGVNPLHGNLFFHPTEASAREHAVALCAAYATSAEKEAAKLRRAAQLFAGNHTTTTTEDLDDEDSEISLDEG